MTAPRGVRVARLRRFLLEPTPALGPGCEIAPRVRLVEPIGSGGMGTVWRAEHESLGSEVAVKLLADASQHDGARLERFRKEAATLSRLRSRHVVRVLDFGFYQGDAPYLVMELLRGEDLASRLARAGRAQCKEVLTWIQHAASGLAAAHEAGVVHRDIKPQNLFLSVEDGEEVLKVLDFGVARTSPSEGVDVGLRSTTTAVGTLLGTPPYMSPEQLGRPQEVDARSDLWSLAVVAYEALTGRVPFQADTLAELAVAMDRGRFERPSRVVPGLSREIDAWFERALAPVPEDRFGSARELADALARALLAPPRRWPAVALVGIAAAGATLALVFETSATSSDPPRAGALAASEAPAGSSSASGPPSAAPAGVLTAFAGAAPVASGPRSSNVVAAAKPGRAVVTWPAATISHAPPEVASPPAAPSATTSASSPRKDRGF